MRVSVQFRFAPDDARWVTSVVVGPEDRDVVVEVAALHPAERSATPIPSAETARSILFVVDLVNARPGESGSFTISDLRSVR
ncbi:MAG: hypothetical protein H0U19_12235 [Acidobacteria bacterium]|nr:hypothetical protein [Acidobacteriota bacterium]